MTPKVKENLRKAVTAYRIIGERIVSLLSLFRDMDANLRKSGMKISFKAYVSLTILTSLSLSLLSFATLSLTLTFLLRFPLIPAILFGFGVGLLVGALTVIGFYLYPVYQVDKVKRMLEDGLPYTTGFMAILAGVGVSPERIFRSMAEVDTLLAVDREARTIIRDVELLGFDLISAMESALNRAPSKRFRDLLEGLIATIRSGGNLPRYLMGRSSQYMRLKKVALRRFMDTLALMSEFYIAILVVGPLIIAIMLAIMAMLGGGGPLDSRMLMYLLTYIGIPLGTIAFLIILDAISPRW